MTDKFRRFVDRFSTGGEERSTLNTAIEIKSNGTATVSSGDLATIVFKRFEDMNRSVEDRQADIERF
jgi:hypothetical protein